MVRKITLLERPIVCIVGNNHRLLNSLSKLLRLNNIIATEFSSAEDFLTTKLITRTACLIVEVNLHNMNGIELLEHINNLGVRLPTIVLSSGNDVSEAIRAMQTEAMDIIEKPFIENTLVEQVLDVVDHAQQFV